MRYSLAAALLALPALARAEDGGTTERRPVTETTKLVIGGSAAPAGKWPDAVALLWAGEQACTGTLIAPTVVLSAGHCIDAGNGTLDLPDSILVGASALSRPTEGETIPVTKGFLYPDSWNTTDASVLILARPSTIEPRAIASGWAKFDIQNSAQVQFVGFGTTDRNGNISTDNLMEATSSITDYNCSTMPGCNVAARPDGELGAGGMGIDTCPGDSGGPMYLLTGYGAFLAGITSRGYDTATYACSEGGIYGRPDKIIDWIETTAGVKVTRGPAPTAEPITVTRGDAGETQIVHNDPTSGDHSFAIVTPPAYGRAAVSSTGVARVCAQNDVAGDDSFVVSVTDANAPTRTLNVRIPVTIVDGDPPDSCDETAFGDDGGCCDAGRSAGGSIPLALIVLGVLGRRRRAR